MKVEQMQTNVDQIYLYYDRSDRAIYEVKFNDYFVLARPVDRTRYRDIMKLSMEEFEARFEGITGADQKTGTIQ